VKVEIIGEALAKPEGPQPDARSAAGRSWGRIPPPIQLVWGAL